MWPNKNEMILACNKTQQECGKGMDSIAKDETLSALLRSNLPKKYHAVSTVKLAGYGVNLRKAGELDPVDNGKGQRSESDLETEGCKQRGGDRAQAKDEYRWTQSEQYKNTVRKHVLDRDNHRCQFCYETTRLNVHHRSYKQCRTKNEIDDCITLCRTCHGFLHDSWSKRKCGKLSPLQQELNE